jgi:hypothetical protein
VQERFSNFFLCLSRVVATNVLNKHCMTSTIDDPLAWGFGRRLATTHCVARNVTKHYTAPLTWVDGLFEMT